MAVIDLADKGLRNGDDISPFIDQYWNSGDEVHIPAGQYVYDGSGLNGERGDCALIGSEDGVEFHRPNQTMQINPTIRCSHGTLRVENITVRGKKNAGPDQSRWRFDATSRDSRCEVINVNHPDGTLERTDSSAFITGDGHLGVTHYKNCYVSTFGNSPFYTNLGADNGDNPVIIENCVIVDSQNSRAGHDGSKYIDCTFIWRNQPPEWHRGGSNARGLRADHDGHNMLVENCHFFWDSGLSGGRALEMSSQGASTSGVVRDIFIETHSSGCGGVTDDPGWSYENINISGPAADTVSVPMATGTESPDLRNEGAVWMPESQTVRPRGGSGVDPTPTPGDGEVPEGYSLLEIISRTSDADIVYEFTIEGDVLRATGRNSGVSSVGEANVEIVDNGDGSKTVTGKTGRGLGDAFAVKGTIISFRRVSGESEVSVFIDGEDVTDKFLGGSSGGDNVPPNARFSVAKDGLTLHLDASDSEDPDGSIVRYAWSVDEQSLSGRVVSADVSSPGTYEVSLTVEDDSGGTSRATRSVDVEGNRDPGDGFQHHIMLETPSDSEFDVGFEVLGTAVLGPESGSSDSIDPNIGSAEGVEGAVHVTAGTLAPDGEDDFFYNGHIWDFDPPSGEEVFFQIDDMSRMSVHDFFPDEEFRAAMNSTIEGLVAELDASPSVIGDLTLEGYLWRVNDMEFHSESVTLQFDQPGEYPLELWLLTEEGIADPLFTTLTITLPDREFPPRANFKHSTNGLKVRFDATNSVDPNGDIEKYVWDFGLATGKGATTTFTFPSEGEYNVTLMVHDETGRVDTMTKSVTVTSS